MVAVPIGRGAYKRLYGGTPEVRLLNRWVEANPANLREGVSVLARPGTTNIQGFSKGSFSGYGSMRGNYTLSGLFDDSLFVVCGSNLFRINQDMSVTTISGTINGTGTPEVTWQKGEGYERLWIADGQLLQYYEGTTFATGTLTKTGTIVNGTDKFQVGGVYYTWGTVFSPSDIGTSSNPYVVKPTNTLAVLDPMNQLVLAINNSGTPGTDYSSTITLPNTLVSATSNNPTGATIVTFKAASRGTGGNSITLVVTGGTATVASGATLSGGGVDALHGCEVPDAQVPITVAQTASYVLVGIGNSQKFYWIQPGAIIIDPLDFASKESNPDNITQMRTVGDNVLIMGEKSSENWYATGDATFPFKPIAGRVYARGAIPGSAVVIDEGVMFIGDDGRVYSVGYSGSDSTDITAGVTRISNNGIEERVRRQLRREEGLTP